MRKSTLVLISLIFFLLIGLGLIRPKELWASPGKQVALTSQQKKIPKFSLSFNYGAGLSKATSLLSWTQDVYYESALYDIDYATKKGNYFGIGVGYQFSSYVGVEIGGIFGSRNMKANYTASLPHPLLFNSPREADAQERFKVNENAVFFNVVIFVPMKRLSLNFFGGPAYFSASANLIKEIKTAETYPYESISLSSQTEKITQNVFGGNVGVGFDFLLSTNFAFFLKGHYFFGKANFDPAGEIPTLSLSLIGGQIGGGIKLRF